MEGVSVARFLDSSPQNVFLVEQKPYYSYGMKRIRSLMPLHVAIIVPNGFWRLERADVTINLRHMMNFGKDSAFDIHVQNGGEIVHSMGELLPVAEKYLAQMGQGGEK